MVRLVRIALLALLAAPAAAHAGDVRIVSRDVPLGARTLQSAAAPIRFNMVGVHWRGTGTVLFRAHRIGGGWTEWSEADADSGPDAASPERARARGWSDGAPTWTGASDRIQVRTHGEVRRVRAYYLWSRIGATPLRTVALTAQPQIISRFGWGADESIVRRK